MIMDFGHVTFHDCMAIGAARTKAVDTRPERLVFRNSGPFLRRGGYLQLLIERLHARIQILKMLVGRDSFVSHRK